MKIEPVRAESIRIIDDRGTSFDLYALSTGGIQIVSTELKGLEVEERAQSVIIREK